MSVEPFERPILPKDISNDFVLMDIEEAKPDHSLYPTDELLDEANNTSQSIYDTSVFDDLYSNDTEKEAFVREIYKREVVGMSSEEMLKSKLYNWCFGDVGIIPGHFL